MGKGVGVEPPPPMPPHQLDEWKIADERERRDIYLEMQVAAFGAGQTYTTIVVFGAFAALFAIWNFTRPFMSSDEVFIVGFLIGVALLLFVGFEIFGMIARSRRSKKFAELFVQDMGHKEFTIRYKAAQREHWEFVVRWLIPIWWPTMLISVVAGFGSAIILLGIFVRELAKRSF